MSLFYKFNIHVYFFFSHFLSEGWFCKILHSFISAIMIIWVKVLLISQNVGNNFTLWKIWNDLRNCKYLSIFLLGLPSLTLWRISSFILYSSNVSARTVSKVVAIEIVLLHSSATSTNLYARKLCGRLVRA